MTSTSRRVIRLTRYAEVTYRARLWRSGYAEYCAHFRALTVLLASVERFCVRKGLRARDRRLVRDLAIEHATLVCERFDAERAMHAFTILTTYGIPHRRRQRQ